MLQHTISQPEWHYLKLRITPHDKRTPIDEITLALLLHKATSEAFGVVDGGHMSVISGNSVETVSLSKQIEDDKDFATRVAMLKVHAEIITPFMAALPLSAATENYTFEILGHSPLLPLARAACGLSAPPGSMKWLAGFTPSSRLESDVHA